MHQGQPLSFGGFRLDTRNAQLWRGDQEIALRPKAFAVLAHLVEHAGQLVTKQQLLDAVWPATFVTDAVLKDSVRQLREALGDDAEAPRFIETAHRRGYRFVSQVSVEPALGRRLDAALLPTVRESPTPPLTTVLGRESELARMNECLERALAGERQVVFVTGEPGIGKTTIVSAFRNKAVARGMWMAWGQCLEHYGAGEAYLPVLEGLSRLGRTTDGERLIELLRRHAPTWLLELSSLISAGEREALRQDVTTRTRERMLREMAEAIEAITAEAPLLMVLEDLHWSDYSTLDLLAFLARRRDRARLLVVGTYRPVDVILGEHPLKAVKRELQAHGLCRELPLEYLTEDAVAQYLAVKLPDHRLPKWLTRLVHRRTEGNPLFMVNLLEYLLAERIIVKRGHEWLLEGAFADIESGIPENVRQLIERQIDRLSADERRALEGASVVGLECSSVAIGAGLEEPTEWVDAQCEALVWRHQFLSPARLVQLPDGTITPRYKFSHVLYLEVPYRLLPPLRRAQIHRRIGHVGEAIYGAHVGEIAAELAMHFEQGADPPRAVRYLLLAAENARHRSAHHEADALARRGLSALSAVAASPERDRQELGLRMILGVSAMLLKGFAADEVKDICEGAIALCQAEDDSGDAFLARWLLGLFYYFRAEMRHCHAIGEELVKRGAEMADPLFACEAACAFGVTLVDLGRFGPALEQFAKVIALCEPQRERQTKAFAGQDPAVTCDCYAARALWARGYPDRAMVRIGRARDAAHPLAPTETRVIASYFTAYLHQLRGEARLAQDHAESAIALADEYGLSVWVALARIIRGWARVQQDTPDEGIDELRRGLVAYAATGARLWRAQSLGLLAEALAKSGQHEEAAAAVLEALDLLEETGEEGAAADLHRIHGDVLLARAWEDTKRSSGECTRLPPRVAAEIEECLTRAISIARAQQARSWELRAASSLARLYLTQEKAADAVCLITPLVQWFTEGHDTADVAAARALVMAAV
ncbi:MAG TPA: AAA family ATPase [Vicinamibacterales bacterium]|nr:AAA family ATPase [Vicinamibacterales bacterium]